MGYGWLGFDRQWWVCYGLVGSGWSQSHIDQSHFFFLAEICEFGGLVSGYFDWLGLFWIRILSWEADFLSLFLIASCDLGLNLQMNLICCVFLFIEFCLLVPFNQFFPCLFTEKVLWVLLQDFGFVAMGFVMGFQWWWISCRVVVGSIVVVGLL